MNLLTLAINWSLVLQGLMTVLFIAIGVIMILTVLIQKPQGGGLAGAFGAGAGSGQTAFGTKTGDALTVFTIIVFVVFLGMAITMNFMNRAATGEGSSKEAPAETTAPAQEPAGTAPAAPASNAPATAPGAQTPAPATPEPAPASTPAPSPSTTPAETPKGPGR